MFFESLLLWLYETDRLVSFATWGDVCVHLSGHQWLDLLYNMAFIVIWGDNFLRNRGVENGMGKLGL